MSDETATNGSDPSRPPRANHALRYRLIALLVLILLIVVASLRHHADGPIPPGRFGLAIGCLERDAQFSVTDAAGAGTAAPGVHTDAVDVSSEHPIALLAEIRHYATAAAASAGRAHNALQAPRDDYLQDGRTLWAWIPGGTPLHLLSNAGQRKIISACVRAPRT